MSERRYVVEIARAVSDDRLESAADYVAQRLGMDRQRIRTLLAGRTGPVTRPVLAEKADSIAEVFTAAGVTVMIREAHEQSSTGPDAVSAVEQPDLDPTTGYTDSTDSSDAVDSTDSTDTIDYEAVYEEEFHGDADEFAVDDDLNEESEVVGFGPVVGAAVAGAAGAGAAGAGSVGAGARDSGVPGTGSDDEEDPEAERSPGDWNVDSAWEAEDDDLPWHEPPATPTHEEQAGQGGGEAASQSPPPPRYQRDEAPPPRDPEDLKLPSTRWVPSPFDEPIDGPNGRTERLDDLKITWGPNAGGAGAPNAQGSSDDLADLETGTSRPWVTPGRSQFGDLSAPSERAPLRSYLLWALVASVVVLIALQLLFAVRERSVGGSSYESGLQAYRSGDFVTARRQWESVAQAGSAEAQYMLGHLVQNGLGQPWSNAAAAQWYQAADQGLPEAQVALADLYIRGVGVEPSLETGASWLERAAASGYGPALYQYAELLLHGRGVPQDFDVALDLFARAAATGSTEAADYVALAEHVRSGSQSGVAQQ